MKKKEQDLINELDAFVYDDTEEVLEFFGSRDEPVAEISISVLSRFIDQELDKAREEGIKIGMGNAREIKELEDYLKKRHDEQIYIPEEENKINKEIDEKVKQRIKYLKSKFSNK